MKDGKPETVNMSHLHALDRRISDHKLEVHQSLSETIFQLVKPMNDLTSEMKLSNKNHEHLEEKISKTLDIAEKNSSKIAVMDKELVRIGTTQGGILGVSGKVFPVVVSIIGSLVILLLSVSIYLKIDV